MPLERAAIDAERRARVAYSAIDGVGYVPGRLLVRGDQAAAALERLAGVAAEPIAEEFEWRRADGLADPEAVVERLVAAGERAQLDHVFDAHGCPPCGPHPMVAHLLAVDPWTANPMRANPMRANPMRANPMRANPMRANRAPENSAVPASAPAPAPGLAGPGAAPRVLVLDTGLASGPQRPAALPPAVQGDPDQPDRKIGGAPADGWLDPVAGHGTFIAGLVERHAPGCAVTVRQVISPLGDVAESDTARALLDAIRSDTPPQIVSMSFGGPVRGEAGALREAIAEARVRGVVVVASAGNDGTCEEQFPAAFPGVVGVGAVGPDGPPEWTNYGCWVDACAPGVDLVSTFFAAFDGSYPAMNGTDPDRFRSWAMWSGTSL